MSHQRLYVHWVRAPVRANKLIGWAFCWPPLWWQQLAFVTAAFFWSTPKRKLYWRVLEHFEKLSVEIKMVFCIFSLLFLWKLADHSSSCCISQHLQTSCKQEMMQAGCQETTANIWGPVKLWSERPIMIKLRQILSLDYLDLVVNDTISLKASQLMIRKKFRLVV